MKCFFTYTEYSQKFKIDFLKGRTNQSQLQAIFPQNKVKLEKIGLMFSSYSHLHTGDLQPNTLIIVSENWFGGFK